jgi:hypothetical protein
MPDNIYDDEEYAYASLADEMNDEDIPWVEDHWDQQAVKLGKSYADKNGLRWPPRMGDFDRYCERNKRV